MTAHTPAIAAQAELHHQSLPGLGSLPPEARADFLSCRVGIWRGAVHSHRAFMQLDVSAAGEGLVRTVTPTR